MPHDRERVSDSCSLLEANVDRTRILRPGQLTDTYLLALAAAHDFQLATLDNKISTAAIADGAQFLHGIR